MKIGTNLRSKIVPMIIAVMLLVLLLVPAMAMPDDENTRGAIGGLVGGEVADNTNEVSHIDSDDSSDSDSSSDSSEAVGPTTINVTAIGSSFQSMYANGKMAIDTSYLAKPGEKIRITDKGKGNIVSIEGHTIIAKHRGCTEVALEVYDPKYDRWMPVGTIQVTVLSGEFAPPTK